MPILNRYISSEILRSFLQVLGVLTVIFITFTASVQLKEATSGFIPGRAAAQLIALNTLIALEVLLPTTLFFGCIAALGRMQNDLEILIMLSAGVSLRNITATVIKIGLLVALVAGLLSILVRPWAYGLSYQIESEALSKLDIDIVQDRQFVYLASSGHVLYAQSVDRRNKHLNQVFLHQRDHDTASNRVISASTAQLHQPDLSMPPVLNFGNGHMYGLDTEGRRDMQLDFRNLQIPLPEMEKLAEYRRKAVPTATLAKSELPRDIAEYQWRQVTPLITLFLIALAVPLTATRPRQSRLASIALALVIYATVFGITSVIRTGVERGNIDAFPGLWLAPLFTGLLLASAMLWLHIRHRVRVRQ